jgi:hypothetical protein
LTSRKNRPSRLRQAAKNSNYSMSKRQTRKWHARLCNAAKVQAMENRIYSFISMHLSPRTNPID